MAKGNAKQRAKKKQQKQQHRKTKLARREGKAAPAGFGASSNDADLLKGWDAVKHGIVGLAQRRKLPFAEAAHYADSAQRGGHPGAAKILTPSRVLELTEEQIVAKLASLGITTDRSGFLTLTEGATSALARAGDVWARSLPNAAPPADHDFVRLAAWDLWRRFRPETPSIETLTVRHLEGWDLYADDERVDEVIEVWLDFGRMLWKTFPEMRSMEDVDAAMNGPTVKKGGFYFDSFVEVLADLATEDAQHHAFEHEHDHDHDHDHEHDREGAFARARKVADYLAEVESRLPQTKPQHLELLLASRANLLDAIGERDAAVGILKAIIDRSPHRAAGYVLLVTMMIYGHETAEEDFDAAMAILEKARATEDAQIWGIEERISTLRALREELHGASR